MNPIINAIIFSLLPISELRGGIPIAIFGGVHPLFAYIICVSANFLVIPLVYFFLDYLHSFFMKIKIYNRLFNKYIEKKRNKLEKYVGTKWEFLALMMFVAIPLPVTGAYTGTLLAWFFGLKRTETYKALGLGVLIAGLIVTLVVLTGINGFEIFIKN